MLYCGPMPLLSFWRGRRDDSSAAPGEAASGARQGRGGPQSAGRRLRPEAAYALTLGAQFALVAYLIVPLKSGAMLLAALLALISVLIRSRFKLEPALMLVDCGLYCAASIVEPKLALLLFVFVYFFVWSEWPWYALVPIATSLILLDGAYRILPIQAALIAGILRLWRDESRAHYEEADALRHRIHRMEATEERLLAEYRSAARLSQLEERQRIAERLHDDLGHELTAAQLSVKSVGALLNRGLADRAALAQQKAASRLDSALMQLKRAVGRLEPEAEAGLGALRSLFEAFSYPTKLDISGEPAWLRAYHLQLLLAAAKEALTNVAKHAIPSRVEASVQITDRIVRLTVENDGVKDAPGERSGSGLRYMRRRLETVRGSLSASQTGGVYRLIVILPKEAS